MLALPFASMEDLLVMDLVRPLGSSTYEVGELSAMSDDGLLVAAARGDEAAFAAIYLRYAPMIRAFCLAMTGGDHHEVEDAVHDCFLAAYRNHDRLRSIENLRSYLLTIARHRINSQRWQRRWREVLVDDLGPMDLPDLRIDDEEIPQRMAQQELLKAVAEGLSQRDWVLLQLKSEGRTPGELAPLVGDDLTPSGVRMNLWRVEQRARAALEAVLLARSGQDRCEGLAKLLPDWDGHLTPTLRKRITRHIQSCPTCQKLRDELVRTEDFLSS